MGIKKVLENRWVLMLVALLFGILLTDYGKFDAVENFNTDLYHVILGERYQPKSTLIVSLDSETIDLFPNTPLAFWGPNFAKVIERLRQAGAASIALDFQFLITPEQWLRTLENTEGIPLQLINYDQSFDQALSKGRVILGARPIRNKYSITTVSDPPLEYLESLPNHRNGIGLTVLLRDSDSVVREFVPAQTSITTKNNNSNSKPTQAYDAPNPWWTYAALAVKEGAGDQYLESFKGEAATATRNISYCGPPGTVPRLSLAVFFRDKGLSFEEKQLISGRIVFIGAEEEHFGDRQRTPYSRQIFGLGHRDMSSVEIHANIAETILTKNHLTIFPLWMTALIIWLPCMVVGILAVEKNEEIKNLKFIDLGLAIIIWIIGLAFFWKGFFLHQAGLASSMGVYFLLIQLKNYFQKKQKANIGKL